MLIDHPTAIAIFLTALGFIGNGYEAYATPRGWPVRDGFRRWAPPSIIIVFLVAGIAWYERGPVTAIGIAAAGFAVAWLATLILRSHVQTLWSAGMITAGMLTAAAWLSKVI